MIGAIIGGGSKAKKYDIIEGTAPDWAFARFKAVPIGTLAGDAYLCFVDIYYSSGAIGVNYGFHLPEGFPKPDKMVCFKALEVGHGAISTIGEGRLWSGGVTRQCARTSYISMMK